MCIKITSGDDNTTGTGEIVLDWTDISSQADIAIYDENDNLLDYHFESFDTTAKTPEMEIQIPADANKCSSRRDEERFVIVKITRDDGKIKHEIHPYNVKALDLVPYPS